MLTQLVVFLFKKIAKCPKKYKKFCKLLSLAKIIYQMQLFVFFHQENNLEKYFRL